MKQLPHLPALHVLGMASILARKSSSIMTYVVISPDYLFLFSTLNCFLGVFGVALHPRHSLQEVMNRYSLGLLLFYCTDLKTGKKSKCGNFPSEE